MKGLVALLVGAALATVGIVVWAVAGSRDVVPDRLRACARDAGAAIVRGQDLLGPLQRDLTADRVVQSRPFAVGANRAVLIGEREYRLLVLAADGNAPLDSETPQRVYRDPGQYAVVALERGPLRVVEGCARIAGRD